ncbi:MAG: TetR/AcrR family transcriptional regulator [Bacteroidota bacterium]|jgi:AcrR family transcriptional regulator
MVENDDETRIIDAATNRFMNAGFYKVTMDEIASDLRMSKKTVYKFFPSKETLLKTIIHAFMRKIEREVQGTISSDKPIEEKLTTLLAFIGKQLRKFSRPFITDVQRFAPALWKEIEIFRRERVLSQLQQMFKQAKKEGVFREDMDPDLFFLVLNTTIQGIMNPQVLSQQPFSAEEAFKGIFRILYEGVLTDEARKRFQFNNLNLSTNEY